MPDLHWETWLAEPLLALVVRRNAAASPPPAGANLCAICRLQVKGTFLFI